MSSKDTNKTEYNQHLIRHAIRALGFSKEERDLKIQMVRHLNLVGKTIGSCLKPNTHDLLVTGSFADGLNFDTSDMDLIRRAPGFKILSSFTLPKFGTQIQSPEKSSRYIICGIEYEVEFPCYVKLPILQTYNVPEFTYIKCVKIYYLKNTDFRKDMLKFTQFCDTSASELHKNKYADNIEYSTHGPAVREQFYDFDSNSRSERDLVLTLFFDEWPCIASEFLSRKRLNIWPSKRILKSMQTKGCDLAAVGHADSREKDLLWRISFCGERDLFMSLNEIQIHCFLLMKIILKDDMPLNKEKDIISSFHLKNVIFWCIECSAKPWTRRHFFVAFKRCLFRLMDFLSNRYMPYYIIPSRNLFNSRLTEEIAEKLIKVCKNYADNPMNILLLASFDGLFIKMDAKMGLSERITNLKIIQLKLKTQQSIIRRCFSVIGHMFVDIQSHTFWKHLSPRYAWHDLSGCINNWENMYNIMFSGYKPYMEYELKYMKCLPALMFFARYKQTNDVMDLQYSKLLVTESLDLKVSSATIRAASFYYIAHDYDRCAEICETFLECLPRLFSESWVKLDRDLAFARVSDIEKETNIKEWKSELLNAFGVKRNGNVTRTFNAIMHFLKDFPYISFKHKCISAVYVTAEKWVVPEVLLYELLSRSKDSDNNYYRQFAGIFVDPIFNAWLLLFLCNRKMNDNYNPCYIKLRDKALESMKRILKEATIQPRYQYCNVYAYCLLKTDLKVEAVKYILESWREYPSIYNVAFSYLKAIVQVLRQIA